METLVARWKAQKSASKHNSVDEMQTQTSNEFSISQNQLFGNQNIYHQKNQQKNNKTEEDLINSRLTQQNSDKKLIKRNNSNSKHLRESDLNISASQNKRKNGQSKDNLHSNSSKQIIVSNSQTKINQSNASFKSTKPMNKSQQFNSNSPAKLTPNKFNEESLIDHVQAQIKQTPSQYSTFNNSNIPPKPLKKNLSYILDEALYKVMDIFKHSEQNQQLSYQDKVSKVRNIFEITVQQAQTMQNPKIQQMEEMEKELQKLKSQQPQQLLQDAHSKIISELENKLFETERQKIQVENENKSLKNKLQVLEEQIQSQELNIQIWQSYKRSSEIIEKTNDRLQEELALSRQQNHDQQLIFDAQISEIQEIITKLKAQMIEKTYPTEKYKENNNNYSDYDSEEYK